MNQQPDKLFRDKLDTYRPAVPPSAWQRVSQNVDKKNRRLRLLRIAASILLLASATLLFYPPIRNGHRDTVAENGPAIRAIEEREKRGINPSEQVAERPAPPERPPDAAQPETRKSSVANVEKKKTVVTPSPVVDTTAPVHALSAASDPIAMEPKISELSQVTGETYVAKSSAAGSNNVVIVFSSEEVNEKYLTINSEADATTEDGQASGLRKLLDKAQDLKHNQDLLGSFRQKKNQILAMNFRGEKGITQND